MITYSRFGRTAGNLGNQLFELAAITAFSKQFECEYLVPTWKYSQFFVNHPSQSDVLPTPTCKVNEGTFNYSPEWWSQYAKEFKTQTVDIFGWLQSWKYFDEHKEEVKKLFTFKPEFIEQVKSKTAPEVFTKPIIAISIRRGDYVGNRNYELLPIRYYLGALLENFPAFREQYNLMIFSDDMEYCRVHFQCLPNAYFADNMSGIEQLCMASQFCTHTIAANSTFSYWIGMLQSFRNIPDHKVIRPVDIFANEMKEKTDISDHYPPEWIIYNHNFSRLNLDDVTFTLPVMFDSNDRRENLKLSVQHLLDNFDTHLIIGEQGGRRFENTFDHGSIKYHAFDGMVDFHRTKMLNDMTRMAKTTIAVNFDADVFIPPMQVIEAAHAIRHKNKHMVYPYDGRFARVPRKEWIPMLNKFLDVGMFKNHNFKGMGSGPYSVGGAIMVHIDKFIEAGMENEKMISYAPEDSERFRRFERLGYNVDRINGPLYHLDHAITMNSSISHKYYQANVLELKKEDEMKPDELREYVKTWPWANQYRPSYYESIHEEAVSSRDEVFKMLEISSKSLSYIHGFNTNDFYFIDAGCGIGSWGVGLKNYLGIDYGVPEDKLIIPKEQYFDHDLSKPLSKEFKNNNNNIVLCLEVAEHIKDEFSNVLIENLIKLGDTIIFSAAIPGQGGVNHVNEQWQYYWFKKFWDYNFFPTLLDFRDNIWMNEKVGVWYRQNMVIYKKNGGYNGCFDLDRVHPKMWTNVLKSVGVIK